MSDSYTFKKGDLVEPTTSYIGHNYGPLPWVCAGRHEVNPDCLIIEGVNPNYGWLDCRFKLSSKYNRGDRNVEVK